MSLSRFLVKIPARCGRGGSVYSGESVVTLHARAARNFCFWYLRSCVPSGQSTILEINPVTNLTFTFGSLGSAGNKWTGIVYSAVTQKLFAVPNSAVGILVVDPVLRTANATSLGGFGGEAHKWIGLGLSKDTNIIVGVPHNTNTILALRLAQTLLFREAVTLTPADLARARTAGTISTVAAADTFPNVGVTLGKWSSVVYAPNTDKFYAAPSNATSVLVLDTRSGAVDSTTLSHSLTGSNFFGGIAYSPETGNLYLAPASASSAMIVDPRTNATDVTALSGLQGVGTIKWHGIAHAPLTAKLYLAPYDAEAALIIDPITNATDATVLGNLGTAAQKWAGIALASNTAKLYSPRRQARPPCL